VLSDQPDHPHLTLNDYLQKILTARVYDVAVETPLDVAPGLSARVGNTVLLKREDAQPVFSFKLRGAYNKMVNLTADQRARGVICASAGNHAQGVAMSAAKLGCSATVVMPVTTPEVKVEAVRSHGADVVLFGDSYSDAYTHAALLRSEHGFTFVYDYRRSQGSEDFFFEGGCDPATSTRCLLLSAVVASSLASPPTSRPCGRTSR